MLQWSPCLGPVEVDHQIKLAFPQLTSTTYELLRAGRKGKLESLAGYRDSDELRHKLKRSMLYIRPSSPSVASITSSSATTSTTTPQPSTSPTQTSITTTPQTPASASSTSATQTIVKTPQSSASASSNGSDWRVGTTGYKSTY